ncbi:MAG: hypothetical protein S4CHLAM45_13390 [Chlamydiales bacterium]|nr:hypothetical protein [Chlamydiales bacterium]MCH9620589.1 hypothetical protein [Chlamydiales bacterium]MCH9623429.1 hypothetical protein [Chlamydiales bacterium]
MSSHVSSTSLSSIRQYVGSPTRRSRLGSAEEEKQSASPHTLKHAVAVIQRSPLLPGSDPISDASTPSPHAIAARKVTPTSPAQFSSLRQITPSPSASSPFPLRRRSSSHTPDRTQAGHTLGFHEVKRSGSAFNDIQIRNLKSYPHSKTHSKQVYVATSVGNGEGAQHHYFRTDVSFEIPGRDQTDEATIYGLSYDPLHVEHFPLALSRTLKLNPKNKQKAIEEALKTCTIEQRFSCLIEFQPDEIYVININSQARVIRVDVFLNASQQNDATSVTKVENANQNDTHLILPESFSQHATTSDIAPLVDTYASTLEQIAEKLLIQLRASGVEEASSVMIMQRNSRSYSTPPPSPSPQPSSPTRVLHKVQKIVKPKATKAPNHQATIETCYRRKNLGLSVDTFILVTAQIAYEEGLARLHQSKATEGKAIAMALIHDGSAESFPKKALGLIQKSLELSARGVFTSSLESGSTLSEAYRKSGSTVSEAHQLILRKARGAVSHIIDNKERAAEAFEQHGSLDEQVRAILDHEEEAIERSSIPQLEKQARLDYLQEIKESKTALPKSYLDKFKEFGGPLCKGFF